MIFRTRLFFATLLLLLHFTFRTSIAHAQDTDRTYVPTSTQVAILPVINASGEKNEKHSNAQCKLVSDELLRLFQSRGFRIIPTQTVDNAMKKLDADLADEEQCKRARMFEIGKEAGADLTVFVLIMDQAQASTELDKIATIKAWLLDVGQQKAILSAKLQEARSNTSNAFNLGSINRALRMAVNDVFKDFLKPYKKRGRDPVKNSPSTETP